MLYVWPRRLSRLARGIPGLTMPLALAAAMGAGTVLAAPPALAEAARTKVPAPTRPKVSPPARPKVSPPTRPKVPPPTRPKVSSPAKTKALQAKTKAPPPAPALAGKVHMGLTPMELTDIVGKVGWTLVGKVKKTSRAVQFKGLDERLVTIYLEDCDKKNRCRAGALSTFSWVLTLPGHISAWNAKNRGVVAWRTETSLHLTRPLHFNGVSDAYLRELFGAVWPKAVAAWERYFASVVMGKVKPAPAPTKPPKGKKPPAETKPAVAKSSPAPKKPAGAKSPPTPKKPPASKKPPAKKPAPEPEEEEEEE